MTTSEFVVTPLGIVNMYGAAIVMDPNRVSALLLQNDSEHLLSGGLLNTHGAAGFPAIGDLIIGNVINSGRIQFGNVLHTLTISAASGLGGNYSQGIDGTLAMRLDNGGIGDALSVGGGAIHAGELELQAFGGSLTPGQVWTLISTGQVALGQFDMFDWPDFSPLWDGASDGLNYVVNNA